MGCVGRLADGNGNQSIMIRRAREFDTEAVMPLLRAAHQAKGLDRLFAFDPVLMERRWRAHLVSPDSSQESRMPGYQDARNWLDKQSVRSQLMARADSLSASVEHVTEIAVGATEAIASDVLRLFAGQNGNNGEINVTAQAVASLTEGIALSYGAELDINGYVTSFKLLNGGAGTGTAAFLVDNFYIGSASDAVAGAASPDRANEFYGNGWAQGGPTVGSVVASTITTNDAKLAAAQISVTASGGEIGPARYVLLYDATNEKPLILYDLGQDEHAGDTTDFKFTFDLTGGSNAIFTLTV